MYIRHRARIGIILHIKVHLCSIYHVRRNIEDNPYGGILVVWLVQELGHNNWVYDYNQTDNECSPWDLEISDFVLPEHVVSPDLPRELTETLPTATAILSYLYNMDFSYVFKYQVSVIDEYCSLFPLPKDQLDFGALRMRAKSGVYDGRDGLYLLFDDLDRMVANCKVECTTSSYNFGI